jgi:putative ATP-dependent endonuclease of the OLD family
MRVARLEIRNFRGIKTACLDFDGHTLLLGMNNVGKSTVCEALELVLGPDRLSRTPPVEEFDFFNARYLEEDGQTPVSIEIDVTLTELSEEVANKCAPHAHHWHLGDKRALVQGEVAAVDDPHVCECLRLKTVATYDAEEDEFEAQTFFVDGPGNADGGLAVVPRKIKQLFGFLYLRALRTGSRALSLERGSLLDVILKQRNVRTGIWESSIDRLRGLDPPIDEGAADLAPILENIEKRLGQYIHLEAGGRATQLFVSQLTREHLRKTISFFLKTSAGQAPVPFQEVGTGTLNTLVLALLTFIADIKKDNVIFAMEEPEIALPPHTQRRIANYLLANTTQCLVTSHSPYLIERFDPSQIQVLRKDGDGEMTARLVPGASVLKGKMYRRHARRGLAEGMLGRGVIVCEGVTEKDVLLAMADMMEESDPDSFYPLDLAGVTIISTDGDGSMPEFGAFFRAMHVKAFALYDAKKRKPEDEQKFKDNFDIPCQTAYTGIEKLLVEETSVARLWQFLTYLRDSGEKPNLALPAAMPAENDVKMIAYSVLEKEKGSGYAGRLIEICDFKELPATIVALLKKIYALFPKPAPIPPIDEPGNESAQAPAAVAAVPPDGAAQ